jgi:hypothetical protein
LRTVLMTLLIVPSAPAARCGFSRMRMVIEHADAVAGRRGRWLPADERKREQARKEV